MNDLFRRALVLGGVMLCLSIQVTGQTVLRPGFEGAEYRELLRVYQAQFGGRYGYGRTIGWRRSPSGER